MEIRNNNGHVIAKISEEGSDKLVIKNKYGHPLGKYSKSRDETYNMNGHRIGHGNLLTTFITDKI